MLASPTEAGPVLVADDDPDLRDLITLTLRRAGFDTICASDGREALRVMYTSRPGAVLLDIGMPELDGWQALERIRDVSEVPVIVLTAHDSEFEKVRALRAGADDYVTKPFSRPELVARLERRMFRRGRLASASEILDDGAVRIDFDQRTAALGDIDLSLTPLEFRLLAAFARHPKQVLSRDQLLDLVWNDPGVGSGDQVKLYVGYLRRKLAAAADVNPIETVRGFGYRYRPPAPCKLTQAG